MVVLALIWSSGVSAADLQWSPTAPGNLSPTATLGVCYSGQIASDLTDNAVKGRFT